MEILGRNEVRDVYIVELSDGEMQALRRYARAVAGTVGGERLPFELGFAYLEHAARNLEILREWEDRKF